MAEPYATPEDLSDRWKQLSDDEASTAATLLSDAAVWLRAWFPDLDARIGGGMLDAQVAVMVSCAMVKRALLALNYEGQSNASSTETMGPFTVTHQAVFKNPEGNLYLTAQEADLLDGRPSGAVSMECAGL